MSFETVICFAAALLTAGVALFVLYLDPRVFVHRVLAAALVACAVEAVITGFGLDARTLSAFMRWRLLQIAVGSLLPAIWLIFSFSFGRGNYKEFLYRWKWVLLAAFIIPIVLTSFFSNSLTSGKPLVNESEAVFLRIGWAGYALNLLSLLSAVMILMNLERTLRYSSGRARWQIKFMVFGVGSLFGIRIFVDSQLLLYRFFSLNLDVLKVTVLILADLLIVISLCRARVLRFDFYVSHAAIYNSLSLVLAGLYFVLVGLMARVLYGWKGAAVVPLLAFYLLAAIVVLSVFFLSDRMRLRRKRFVSRHFRRPLYDYQRVWGDFTQKTAALTQARELCSILTRMVSETLEVPSVSIWRVDEQTDRLNFSGSTGFAEADVNGLKLVGKSGMALARVMRDRDMPVHLAGSTDRQVEELREEHVDVFEEARIRYCVALRAAGRFVGLMTLSNKVKDVALSPEDYDLLKTIADQAAATLLSLGLSERLRQVKELEALQTMSAFFMHDLKNLASKLSLVTQNLPVHFDNAEFRGDALKAISQSVSKINGMCTRLSLLSQKLELSPKESDVNQLVEGALEEFDTCLKVPVIREFGEGIPIKIDSEQIQKVVINLLMNAHDAILDDGQIKVRTDFRDGWVRIIVSDNGCGMSPEFVKTHLFRPFSTTKKQGMGIGLFHCKSIVEAHGGRIEVESELGAGSIFTVLLPGGAKAV